MGKELKEIERKFLVLSGDFKHVDFRHTHISQGFLNSNPDRTVRVRIREDHGYITIKGNSGLSGLSRFEWEKEIPVVEARELLKLCEPGQIEKVRYEVNFKGHLFEVDVFEGKNEGLIIAEIELREESEPFPKPDWLGKEVTGDIRFYNSFLSHHPYQEWKNQIL